MSNNCCGENKEFKDLSNLLKIVSEKNRFSILEILRDKEMCICDICECLDLPQNLVSHHLKVLKEVDLIDSRKDGIKVICSLRRDSLKGLFSLFSRFIN